MTTSTAVAPIPTNAALEFTELELKEVKKWTTLYGDADKGERYQMLKDKILPRLFLINELPGPAWKERKSVSSST